MPIETLRPNSDVVTDGWVTGTIWDKIDEAVADDATTYTQNNFAGAGTFRCGLPNSSVGAGVINSVTIYRRHWSSGVDGWSKNVIKTNGVSYLTDQHYPNTTWTNRSVVYNTNPQTSSSWTWAEINALEIGADGGIDSAGDVIRITQMYIEIDYDLAPTGSMGIIIT